MSFAYIIVAVYIIMIERNITKQNSNIKFEGLDNWNEPEYSQHILINVINIMVKDFVVIIKM